MAFQTPTLKQLIDREIADIDARITGADARLRRAFLNVLARVHAGGMHGLYGYLAWRADQQMPDTAESEYLERWASVMRGYSRNAAVAAAGNVTFTGLNGSIIPAGTLMQNSAGVEYASDAEATIASGTTTFAVTAVVGGTAGNAEAGTPVTLVSPIAGVSSAGVVAAGDLDGGTDTETDEQLRERLLTSLRAPPQGGAAHDYIAWAKEVPGVTRAWVFPNELGPGTVTVRFMRDDDPGSPVPDGAEVTAVQAYLDERRSVTAALTVLAPVAVAVNFTIGLTPDTAEVRAAVEAELTDLLRREASPGGSAPAIVYLSHIRAAISLATGETDHELTVPSADVSRTTGQIATMGTITWV